MIDFHAFADELVKIAAGTISVRRVLSKIGPGKVRPDFYEVPSPKRLAKLHETARKIGVKQPKWKPSGKDTPMLRYSKGGAGHEKEMLKGRLSLRQ